MKKALITGITGQDGSYLAELLLSDGYEVHGVIRRSSTFNTARIDHIYVDPYTPGARLKLHYGDLTDSELLSSMIYNTKPDEIYHLGAQSHVRVSFDTPEYTGTQWPYLPLGFHARVELDEGLKRTLESYREVKQPSNVDRIGPTA